MGEESTENLQEGLGFKNIKVVGLTERKFLLRSDKEDDWKNLDTKFFSKWFSIIRKFKEEDLIVPRTA